jgi:hypothetical protein
MPARGAAHAVLLAFGGWTQAPLALHETAGVHSVPAFPQAVLGMHAEHKLLIQAVVHFVPHAPQLAALLVVSTHVPLQLV